MRPNVRIAILLFFAGSASTFSVAADRVEKLDTNLDANLEKAVSAWKAFSSCATPLREEKREAEFNRCLGDTMSPDAKDFEKTKATEFLMLELPVHALQTCPAPLQPAQRRRQTQNGRYACFELPLKGRPLQGEIEFAVLKTGALKVRAVRYGL